MINHNHFPSITFLHLKNERTDMKTYVRGGNCEMTQMKGKIKTMDYLNLINELINVREQSPIGLQHDTSKTRHEDLEERQIASQALK